jgi:aspartyl-tRNA(Asn)/glutamyl-tRNA(Gln) amidotransferase subunit A
MQPSLSIAQAAAAIRRGDLSPRALVAECLARIDRFEDQVRAWVVVDRAGACEAAERAGREIAAGTDRGVLHGIPVGIKDIVDAQGLPTRAGSPLTDARPANRDATVVERLRAAGAIILGKTVTTEFACFDPSPTRNPWNVAHTPGGSSSGSAAAVALGMCLGAIGSQTGGSITRPASYCGIAGCKPTFGRTSRAGVVPVSFHLDHVGTMGRGADDCARLLHAIAGPDARDPAAALRANLEIDQTAAGAPPRLGVTWQYFFDEADDEVAQLTRDAIHSLVERGATLAERALAEGFSQVHAMHRRLYVAEAADVHRALYGAPRDGYGPKMKALLDEGFATSMADYQEALRHQVAFRSALERTLAEVDALVTPATPTAAPAGLESTGDPKFNSPWSYAGVPTVSIPCALSAAGLPLALQLVGSAWSEQRLLEVAAWCQQTLGFHAAPPMSSA